MIIEPTLLDHPKFLRLARRVGGAGHAALLLLRLWGHCQAECRREFWPGADAEYVEAVGRWEGESGVAFAALVAVGFVVQEDGGVRIHDWDKANASMLQRWDSGKKGGRKPPVNRPVNRDSNPGSPERTENGPPVNRPVNRDAHPGTPTAPPRGDERRGEEYPPTPEGAEAGQSSPLEAASDPEPNGDTNGHDPGESIAQDPVRAQAEQVWAVWPKKVQVLAALTEVCHAIRRDGFERVLDGTRRIAECDRQRKVSPPGRYLPQPTEFFRESRYLDDPEQYGPRAGSGPAGAPLGIRVRDLAAQLAEITARDGEGQSRDWWKMHRELQAMRRQLLDDDSEPLGVRIAQGSELLRWHVGNPDNSVGSGSAKKDAEHEFRSLRSKWKALRANLTETKEVEP